MAPLVNSANQQASFNPVYNILVPIMNRPNLGFLFCTAKDNEGLVNYIESSMPSNTNTATTTTTVTFTTTT